MTAFRSLQAIGGTEVNSNSRIQRMLWWGIGKTLQKHKDGGREQADLGMLYRGGDIERVLKYR